MILQLSTDIDAQMQQAVNARAGSRKGRSVSFRSEASNWPETEFRGYLVLVIPIDLTGEHTSALSVSSTACDIPRGVPSYSLSGFISFLAIFVHLWLLIVTPNVPDLVDRSVRLIHSQLSILSTTGVCALKRGPLSSKQSK